MQENIFELAWKLEASGLEAWVRINCKRFQATHVTEGERTSRRERFALNIIILYTFSADQSHMSHPPIGAPIGLPTRFTLGRKEEHINVDNILVTIYSYSSPFISAIRGRRLHWTVSNYLSLHTDDHHHLSPRKDNIITKMQPTQNDVLSGRGACFNQHPGNKHFRRMLDAQMVSTDKFNFPSFI